MSWFVSYLSNRRQYESVRDASSTCKSVKYGIPQRSVIGPLIFIDFINDIVNVSSDVRITMFGDDTSASCSHENPVALYRTMNGSLELLQ